MLFTLIYNTLATLKGESEKALNIMKQTTTHAISYKKIPQDIEDVLYALTLSFENIKNSTLYLIRNIYLSYVWDKSSKLLIQKPNLNANSLNVLTLANVVIANENIKLQKTFDIKKAKYDALSDEQKADKKKNKDPKLSLLKPFTQTITSDTMYQILNDSFVENLLRYSESLKPVASQDYTTTPSIYAQPVLQNCVKNFNDYFKALNVFYKCPNRFKAKPEAPNYLDKNTRCGVDFSNTRIGKTGTFPKILPHHQIFSDKNKEVTLCQKKIDAFNKFDFKSLINTEMKRLPKKMNLGSIRLTPKKRTARTQRTIVSFTTTEVFQFEANSLASQIEIFNENFFTLDEPAKLSTVQKYLNQVDPNGGFISTLPVMAGFDLGLKNLGTITFSNASAGNPNFVISANNTRDAINSIELKIDKRISELATTKVNELKLKKAKGEKLNFSEIQELNIFQKTIFEDKKIIELYAYKENLIKDICHKLSKTVVEKLKFAGAEILIIGKNIGWKDECDMWRKTNREFCGFPHARLIELIQYKALREGIIVLLQEESYTSIASFALNDNLPVFSENTSNQQQFSGKRNKAEHRFYSYIHDDVNGAFNILCKAISRFKYQSSVFLWYVVEMLVPHSPKKTRKMSSFTTS